MGNSGHGMPTAWGTDVDPRGAVDVPAVSRLAPGKNWFRNWLDKVRDFLNIFDAPRDVRPSKWCQPACGFALTLMYLVGVILIIVIYTIFSQDGRPPVVDIEYVSPEKIQDGSTDDYSCTCDLPAQVQNYRKDDPDTQMSSRRQYVNRCYSKDELQDIDVLQFGDDTQVRRIIDEGKWGRTPYVRTLNSSYTVRWKSYELTSRNESRDLFHDSLANPIYNLSQQLEERGYVGTDGILRLRSLASQPFFTVPQGFMGADVNYNCSTCTACRELWAKFGAAQAAPEPNSPSWGHDDKDDGWIFCYQTSGDLEDNDGFCQGACRFFPTLQQPWGIAMYGFGNELALYIPDGDNPLVTFRSRVVYAFVEELSRTPNETYQLSFLDVQRSDSLWTEIRRSYSNIKSCATDNVDLCTGTSICQAAAIYAPEEINSETREIALECSPKESPPGPRTQCEATKELELEFRDKNETRLEHLCDPFRCESVPSSKITWNGKELVGGEIALSRLIYTPSVISRYRPSLCTNNYTQVFLKRSESDPKQLISIHEMKCSSRSNAKVCWMTGAYKNVTDTSSDPWRNYTFTADEMAAKEKIFACYRFGKEGYPKYMYEQFGVVSGNIGSWLLVLSCIFWVITKTSMPARVERYFAETRWAPHENPETSDRPHNEMNEIVTGPDETQGQNNEDDNTSEQTPTKQKTSYQRLPK